MTGRQGVRSTRSPRAAVAACLAGVVLLAGGCNSDDGSAAPDTRPTTTTTSGPRVTGVAVDITITGDRTATVQGTKGKCTIPEFGAPTYEFSGADYPSLGAGGSISIAGPVSVANGTVPANAKVTITGADPSTDVGFLSTPEGTGITLTRNQLVVMLDAPLTGGLGGAEDISLNPAENDLSARMSGSIRCRTGNSSG
jgi:hypothetical protein